MDVLTLRPQRPQRINTKRQSSTDELARAIPYWPETISYAELTEITGLSKASISVRVSSCHEDYLIFADNGRLSRLKQDLSNL